MNLQNVRFGLATNSSSSHSMVWFDREIPRDNDDEDQEYGWEHFTLASEEARRRYFGQQVLGNLIGCKLSKDTALELASHLAAVELNPEGYVDHQSRWSLPVARVGHGLDLQFVKELREYVLSPGLVILGGNDNDGTHPLLGSGRHADTWIGRIRDGMNLARKDGDFWVIFNRETGAKIRFSFASDPTGQEKQYTKASSPELVDVKITDFCTAGCEFCYQDSSPIGKHAAMYGSAGISTIAESLGELGVFEVAIGGGEPTAHPEFERVLRLFRDAGVVPNFTTNSMSWLRDDALARRVFGLAGSVAFSVNGNNVGARAKELSSRLYMLGVASERVVLQYVLGSDYGCVENLLAYAAQYGFPVTLLGFKEIGRGRVFRKNKYDDWIKLVKKKGNNGVRVSIDTALAAECEEEILDAGLPTWMFNKQEGKFSAYIDAVAGTMAPSSYCEPRQFVKLERMDSEAISRVFAGF